MIGLIFVVWLLITLTVVGAIWFRQTMYKLRPGRRPDTISPMAELRQQFEERLAELRYLPVSTEERLRLRLDLEAQFLERAQELME